MLIVQVLINGLLLGGLYGIMALGMSLIWGVMNIVNIARIPWTSDLRQVTPAYAGTHFTVGEITVPYVRFWVFVTTVALSVLFLLLLEKTRLGRAIRATSEELRAARLTGIPVAHIYAVTFGLGAALAGAAGGLWGMLVLILIFRPTGLVGRRR